MHANARNSPKASGTKTHAQSHTNTRGGAGLSTPTRCSKMTIRTTRQRGNADTRAQAGTGQENDTSALLVDAIRDQSRDPKARHRMEGRSWESHKTHTPPHQHQTQTSQPIHIWWGNTSNQLPGAPAPSDPRHHRRRNANWASSTNTTAT
jgi:hypothetical protein